MVSGFCVYMGLNKVEGLRRTKNLTVGLLASIMTTVNQCGGLPRNPTSTACCTAIFVLHRKQPRCGRGIVRDPQYREVWGLRGGELYVRCP